MRSRRTALPLLAVLLVVLGACGDDDPSEGAPSLPGTVSTVPLPTGSIPSTGSEGGSTTTGPPATGDPGGSSTPEPPDEPEARYPDNPTDYSSELVRAWGRGDRERSLELASPSVVDVLFGHRDPGGGGWDLDRCEGAAGTAYCEFVDEASGEHLVLRIPSARDPYGKPQAVAAAEFGGA